MEREDQLEMVVVWINVLNVIKAIIDTLNRNVRWWWTKPDISEQQRMNFGAFSTIFTYMKNTDQEKLYDFIGMSLEQFSYLYNLVENRLAKRSRRTPLPAELRLAATLYYLHNEGSIQMSASFFRIGTSIMYEMVPEVCRALCDDWRIIADGFRDKWNFPNCLGAVDGRHFRIITPANSGSFFFNYKKFSSVVLMSVCDSFLRFTWCNVGDYGSSNDAEIFKESDLGQALDNGNIALPPDERLPSTNIKLPYFFIGDGNFALKKYFITPFTRLNNLSLDQRVFNYRLSRARRTIESAFGILVSKWKIFGAALTWKLENVEVIISACTCLHNFLISCQMQNEERRYYDANVFEGEYYAQADEDENIEDVQQDLNGIQIRNILREYFVSPLGSVPWQWTKL